MRLISSLVVPGGEDAGTTLRGSVIMALVAEAGKADDAVIVELRNEIANGNEKAIARAAAFWSRIDVHTEVDSCWRWLGAHRTDRDHQYGRVKLRGKNRTAHRVAYILVRGEIGDGLLLDHLCRTPSCCNPWHLEPVTPRENQIRGVGPIAENALKVQCKHGHLFEGDNIYLENGSRKCETCRKNRLEAMRSAYQKAPRKNVSDEQFSAMVRTKLPWTTLAARLGVSDVALIKRARKLGVYQKRNDRK